MRPRRVLNSAPFFFFNYYYIFFHFIFQLVPQIGHSQEHYLLRALSFDHVHVASWVRHFFSVNAMATLIERKYKMMLLAWVGPFKLRLTQINSQMNCIAMHKCAKTKKLGNVKEAFRHRYFNIMLYILRTQM